MWNSDKNIVEAQLGETSDIIIKYIIKLIDDNIGGVSIDNVFHKLQGKLRKQLLELVVLPI